MLKEEPLEVEMLGQEPLTEVFTVAMTAREKEQLRTLAYIHGATMGGLVRKLIRDAARTQHQQSQHKK